LIDKVYAAQTLWAAWQRVVANHGAAGIDRMSVERFEAQAARYLAELARALREGSYQPKPVRRVHIPKGKGQTRPLGNLHSR
jgi:RNA-directed DNA polymerase